MQARKMAFVLPLMLLGTPSASAEERVDYHRHIRPILSDKCYKCHGPDKRKRRGGFRLDTKEGAFEDLGGYKAIVPGNAVESHLIKRIFHESPRKRMPPVASKLSLSSREKELLKKWIDQGAEWQRHWSFIPIEKAPLPRVKNQQWLQQAMDCFVLSRLEKEAIAPSPRAAKEKLIRRATFDLTGLPPTLAEIDAFLADQSPNAFEKVVNRLLASPHFGERLATQWLDLSRYADTYGYQSDVYRAMWPWRDWVIKAFNHNLPFDRFVTWQLAGDLLKNPTREQILATAFNRHHRQTNEGGSIEEEWRNEYVADRVNTFGYAFLGLTLECARCHDHKYDPIRQKEYYQLFSFFNNIDESGLYSHFTNAVPTPTLLLPNEGQEQAIRLIQDKIEKAEAREAQIAIEQREAFRQWLKNRPAKAEIPGLIGDFPLEQIEKGKITNRTNPKQSGRAGDNPKVVPGKVGNGILLSGENNLTIPVGGTFTRNDPFSIALWIYTPSFHERAVIFHRSRAWTDAGSRGYQLLIEKGHLSASLIHFWPGNAIRIRTKARVPLKQWTHVVMTSNGNSQASGLELFVDGKEAVCDTIRDHLYKNISGGGANSLTIGQRFRDKGFKHGRVDEIQIYNRAISALESAQLFNGKSLREQLQKPEAELTTAQREALWEYYIAAQSPRFQNYRKELKSLRQERSRLVDPIPEIMVMQEMESQRPTFVLKRGAYDAPGEKVERGTPTSVLPWSKDLPQNRLGLAQWLMSSKNPLTARVVVNRVWQSLFGRGLVGTPEDFGSQGQSPSHPELLDHMAFQLIDSGWDLKKLYRGILLSATYQQSSTASPALLKRDPQNLLLARGPRYRLTAEMLRDNALSVSGLLVSKIGGPPVKPYQPGGLWKEKSGKVYRRDSGEGSHRRSLYTYWKRTSPPPSMLTLDAAKRDICTVKRQATSTPVQPLVLLNDPQYVEAAIALAERARSRHKGLEAQIRAIFRTLTSRQPSTREMAILQALYREQLDWFQAQPQAMKQFLAIGDYKPKDQDSGLAALTVLAKAVLSFDEAVMKR